MMTIRRLLLSLLILLLGLGIAGVLLLDRVNLGPLAARGATAALGRPVAIASLHVTPGRWLRIDLAGLAIDNLAGGTRPRMVELGAASLEVRALSLISGPVAIRGASAEDARVLLERLADRSANWHFGPRKPPSAPDRSWFPSLDEVTLRRGELDFRTTGGLLLRSRADSLTLSTTGDDAPVRLVARGGYNDTAITLDATLGTIATLRDVARPYPTDLHFQAGGDTRLTFTGTMTDPLNVDGATGQVSLVAPKLDTILAIAGAPAQVEAAVAIAGALTRRGDLWRLVDAGGQVAGGALTVTLGQLTEGTAGQPDAIAVDLSLASLDLDRLLPTQAGAADAPLTVSERPDPLLDLRLALGDLTVGGLRLTEAELVGTQAPGRIRLSHVAATTGGLRLEGSAEALAIPEGVRATAEASLADGDLDDLRKRLGLRSLPMSGRLQGQIAASGQAADLNALVREAQVFAVIGMRGGRIARQAIELASTDVRALFRTAEGTTPVACLLGVASLRAGQGRIAPLRIRSEIGSIIGIGDVNLGGRTLDIVVGSQSSTTGALALDIPVRIAGPFADPSIRPAEWSQEGRRQLASGDDFALLPENLRAFAQANPCYRSVPRR